MGLDGGEAEVAALGDETPSGRQSTRRRATQQERFRSAHASDGKEFWLKRVEQLD